VSIILINVLAFFIAYALTQKLRGANLFRTVFFMPNLIGGVVLGYIWSLIFDGILKNYSTYLTASGTYGFWGLVILVAWQQIGYMMIIYIAGLQAKHLYAIIKKYALWQLSENEIQGEKRWRSGTFERTKCCQ
jgi:raffinose/stachyose/melibiose transport system permease protein